MTGLLAAAPAACWCPAGDHVGQLLHARFAHDHASDHASTSFGQADDVGSEATQAASAPAWSSAAGHGPSHWQAGVQILSPLSAAFQIDLACPRLALDAARPIEHVPGPTFPPPR